MVRNPNIYVLEGDVPRDAVVGELGGMPAALRSVIERASPAALTHSGSGEWSAFQTLCHFRDAALVYSMRFRLMVFDPDPMLVNYDENNWVAAAHDTPADVPGILDEIAGSRSDLVRVLSRIDEPAWERTGQHQVWGEVVLEDYVRHQLAHERQHLEQIITSISSPG